MSNSAHEKRWSFRRAGTMHMASSRVLLERYANACTRSGLGALVFGCVGLLTFARTFDYEIYRDALQVARLGEQLELGLEQIDRESCWPNNQHDEHWRVVQLYLSLCKDGWFLASLSMDERSQWAAKQTLPRRLADAINNGTQTSGAMTLSIVPDGANAQPVASVAPMPAEPQKNRTEELEGVRAKPGTLTPMPPTNLTVTFYEINSGALALWDAIRGFQDERLVRSARAFSNDFDFRLYRWLQQKTLRAQNPNEKMPFIQDTASPVGDDLTMSIQDVRYLARSFPIKVPEVEVSGSNYRVGIPTLAIAASLRDAGYLVSTVLLLLSLYFWANCRLVASSPTFPDVGTVFYVFLSSMVGRVALSILTVFPGIAALLLAYKPLDLGALGVVLGVLAFGFGAASLWAINRSWVFSSPHRLQGFVPGGRNGRREGD